MKLLNKLIDAVKFNTVNSLFCLFDSVIKYVSQLLNTHLDHNLLNILKIIFLHVIQIHSFIIRDEKKEQTELLLIIVMISRPMTAYFNIRDLTA